MGEERIYTIPLRNVKGTPRWKRSKKAVVEIEKFLRRHMKTDEIKLDYLVNERIWERGAKKPPSKIRVRAIKEDGVVSVELVE
jgi:large subunit ribosomal protein L31e